MLVALLLGSAGCQAGSPDQGKPAARAETERLKTGMTALFSGLEMYAHDHSLAYPDEASVLVPKYIDTIPSDPVGGEPLLYQKTERGYLISATGDYSSRGAAKGYPKMDQDGFFALKAEDFPGDEDL